MRRTPRGAARARASASSSPASPGENATRAGERSPARVVRSSDRRLRSRRRRVRRRAAPRVERLALHAELLRRNRHLVRRAGQEAGDHTGGARAPTEARRGLLPVGGEDQREAALLPVRRWPEPGELDLLLVLEHRPERACATVLGEPAGGHARAIFGRAGRRARGRGETTASDARLV